MNFLRGEALDERADPKWVAITSDRVTLARINYTIKESYGEPHTPAGLGESSTAAVIGKTGYTPLRGRFLRAMVHSSETELRVSFAKACRG